MDVSKELAESSTKKTFIKHVFDVEEESQNEMLNIVQYSLLALIPVLLLNKSVQTLFPEADESKNNIEIALEIVGQTIVMFLGMVFIHRLVTYVPTYSKVDYSPLRVTNVVIAFLTIVLSIQSRIGEKANILFDRLMSYFRPLPKETSTTQPNQTQGNVPMPPGGGFQVNVMPNAAINHSLPPIQNASPQNHVSGGGHEQASINDLGLMGGGFDDVMAANEGGSMWGSAF
jgi:hypothetical protein